VKQGLVFVYVCVLLAVGAKASINKDSSMMIEVAVSAIAQ
jgi:hypothetical protein